MVADSSLEILIHKNIHFLFLVSQTCEQEATMIKSVGIGFPKLGFVGLSNTGYLEIFNLVNCFLHYTRPVVNERHIHPISPFM